MLNKYLIAIIFSTISFCLQAAPVTWTIHNAIFDLDPYGQPASTTITLSGSFTFDASNNSYTQLNLYADGNAVTINPTMLAFDDQTYLNFIVSGTNTVGMLGFGTVVYDFSTHTNTYLNALDSNTPLIRLGSIGNNNLNIGVNPTLTVATTVPEPQSLALMLLGFAIIGLQLYKRQY